MDKNTSNISVSEVTAKLKKAYRSFHTKKKSVLFLRAFLIALTGFTTLIIAEEIFYFSAAMKSVSILVLVSVIGFSIWYGYQSLSSQSFEDFYRSFSRKSNLPELKDSLDLEKSGTGNRELINAAILQNLTRLESSRLEAALSSHLNKSEAHQQYKSLLLFSGLLLLVASVTVFNFRSSANRSLTFWKNYEKPNPYVFTITPGDVTVEQGSPFQVEVAFQGNLRPEEVSLQIKTEVEEKFRSRGMNLKANTYSSIPFDLNNNMEYFIQMDEYQSPVHKVTVQLPPRFTDLKASVIPPAYTNLDSVQLSYPFAQIRAYQGSEIRFYGLINKTVSSLSLTSTNDTTALKPRLDNTFETKMKIVENDTLSFSMADENGLSNKNPFQVILSSQQDEYPVVELIEPKASFEKVNPKNLDIIFRASDDFGLTNARLGYELRRAYVKEPITETIPLSTPENGVLQPFSWNLEELRLKPQDVLSFWIEADDNDGYNGRKSSRSQVLTLTVPSMVDYFEGLDEKEKDVGSELDDISESFKQMQDSYEQFKEKMKETPEQAGYEQKRELEQTKKMQEDVQKKVEELNKKFEEIKKELSENSMLSEETQQAYEELQKLMEEIDDPEFLKTLEEMRKNIEQFSPDELRKMMEKTEFKEEEYKERIERTIELFKQLKLNSDLDKLAKAFDDLARKEKELSDSNPQAEEESQQKEKTIEETEKLQEQVEELSENVTKQTEKPVSEYQQQADSELKKLLEKLSEQLNQAQQKAEQGEQSQQNQKQNSDNSQSYQQLAEMTRQLQKSISKQQMQINQAGLQYTLYSMLNLSLEQEDLVSLASATENRSQAYIGYARNQKNIESIFANIADSLYQLSTQIPQFSNQINTKKLEVEKQLSRSLEQMAERSQSQSSVASRQALGGINDIAFMVANLLEQLQNSQSGGGGGGSGNGGMSTEQMMKQLKKSGESQQQLNQQMQDMINDIQGERLSNDQMERLNQLAKQQNQIRKQLEELQRKGALEGGDKLGSELQRMVEEMEDTINDLRGGSTDPTLIKRQQNILSRMLEAENAMQERDQEEKREGTTADDITRPTPPELTLEELEKQIRNRLNDPNFTKYSADYQRLIEKYFELLKNLQKQEIQ